jgi:hypothetical protein
VARLMATSGGWHFAAGLVATLGEGHFRWGDWWLPWEKCIFVPELVASKGIWCGDWWLRWFKGFFEAGLMATLGEGHFVAGLVATLGERRFFVAGLVATLGERHFCGFIGGYVGRRAFLWLDWWLRWKKGGQVGRWLAKLGNGASL